MEYSFPFVRKKIKDDFLLVTNKIKRKPILNMLTYYVILTYKLAYVTLQPTANFS